MHYKDIDEIIKRSFQESERKSDSYAMEAKLRVWDAIEKPRRKKGIYIGFVLAMAAAVSFFLVSTILFFRLESKQKELMALKASVKPEIPTKSFQNETLKQEEKQVAAINPERISESTREAKMEEVLVKKQSQSNTAVIDLKETVPLPEGIPPSKKTAKIPEVNLSIPENLIAELNPDLESPMEIREEETIQVKPKNQRKVRFRFGSSNPNFNSGNSLALNIKL